MLNSEPNLIAFVVNNIKKRCVLSDACCVVQWVASPRGKILEFVGLASTRFAIVFLIQDKRKATIYIYIYIYIVNSSCVGIVGGFQCLYV